MALTLFGYQNFLRKLGQIENMSKSSFSRIQQSRDLVLSLGAKSRFCLIRAQCAENWSWVIMCNNLAVIFQLPWGLLSCRIQLSLLNYKSPLKKKITRARASTNSVDLPAWINTAMSHTKNFLRVYYEEQWLLQSNHCLFQLPHFSYL